MKIVFSLFAFFLFFFIFTQPSFAVVNGTPASYNNWSSFAKIEFSSSKDKWHHRCGGSFLAEDIVVTAKHCITSNGFTVTTDPAGLRVVYKAKTPLQEAVSIEKVILLKPSVAPEKDWGSDIAILKLKRSVAAAIPIKILEDRIHKRNTVYKAGFGWNGTSDITAENFEEISTNVQDMRSCVALKNYDLPNPSLVNNLCLEDFNNKQRVCKGDSGGPAVVDTTLGRRLVGITSFGQEACPIGRPDVDLKLSSPILLSWIKRTVRRYSTSSVVDTEAQAIDNVDLSNTTRVPRIIGLNVIQAKRKLRNTSFLLGKNLTSSTCGFYCKKTNSKIIRAQSLSPGFIKTKGLTISYSFNPRMSIENK